MSDRLEPALSLFQGPSDYSSYGVERQGILSSDTIILVRLDQNSSWVHAHCDQLDCVLISLFLCLVNLAGHFDMLLQGYRHTPLSITLMVQVSRKLCAEVACRQCLSLGCTCMY